VEVEVADSGEGIPSGEGERVFEAFYRGEGSRNEDGAGLGLAISRAIVEAHGGRIWLEDGHPGTRVRFTLPT
jgi:signal transduction histidine kinase